MVDLVNKYPRDQLPAGPDRLRHRPDQGYDYLPPRRGRLVQRGRSSATRSTDRFCILGEPDEHIAKLRELEAAGVDQFNLYLMNGDEEAQLEAYGRDVIPAFAT